MRILLARTIASAACVASVALLLVPAPTFAQFGQSGIAGTVRDTTDAVLPGVTVEAASPVLIERVLTAVTDGQGLYRFDDLRPGEYTVTFTLPSFNTLIRDGIQLPSSFTATVNVVMTVGSLDESVTVTGESPTVDIHSVTSQQVFSSRVIEALPARRGPYAFSAFAPAVTSVALQDALASNKDQLNVAAYGGRIGEAIAMVDGVSTLNRVGGGSGGQNMRISPAYVQESTVVLGGASAEHVYGGVVTNVVPKEGGNTVAVEFYADFAPSELQADNLTSDLRARGVPAISEILEQWDANVSIGAPIVRDQLWAFLSYRDSTVRQTIPGTFADLNPLDWVYTPDLSAPGQNKVTNKNLTGRLTWQATPRDRIAAFFDHQPQLVAFRAIEFGHAIEGTTFTPYEPNSQFAAVWKSAVSSRLLIENRVSWVPTTLNAQPHPHIRPGTVSALETTTGRMLRANSNLGRGAIPYAKLRFRNFNYSPSVSYVTGSHTFKAGVNLERQNNRNTIFANRDIAVRLRNGVPIGLRQYPTPYTSPSNTRTLAVFAQDQWTFNRWTLNLGVRFDHFVASIPAYTLEAVQFAPRREFAAEDNTANFKDISPRLGAVYDLSGDGRTALKVNVSRYVSRTRGRSAQTFASRADRSLNMTGLTWMDDDGNFFPNCDLTNFQANGACGRISNLNFGLLSPAATIRDDDVLTGWGNRPYNWAGSVSIEHQLSEALSVTTGYHRRTFGNFTVTQNQATTPADYDPYCITAPVDPRLPGGGGYQVCGLTDVKPEKRGQRQNRIRNSNNFGTQFEHYNGVDLSLSARLPHNVLVTGGLNTGRSEEDTCFVVNSDQDLFNCNIKPPFATNVKVYGIVPMPGDFQVAAVFQRLAALPGQYVTGGLTHYQVTYRASNAEIAPSLGRNLSSGASGSVRVPIVPPGEVFADATHALDVRITKVFQIGRVRILGNVDLNNLYNNSGVQLFNTTFGPDFDRPLTIQPARYVKFSAQVNF